MRDTTTGLNFEKENDLIKLLKCSHGDEGTLYFESIEFRNLKTHNLYRHLDSIGINYKAIISKKLLPDECFLLDGKIIIFEKKFQKTAGSADEKLQTCDFKKKQYQRLFPLLQVEYVYILSDWFKDDSYKDVLEYINNVGCHYIYASDDNFLDFIREICYNKHRDKGC